MKKINLAINGFGRIGRSAFKIIVEKFPNINIVGINDLASTEDLAYLLQYDSAYGIFNEKIKHTKNAIYVGKKKVPFFSIKNPQELPWQKLKVDVVLECTGQFKDKDSLSLHIQAGAKKVVLSAPAKKDGIKTVVLGVNEKNIRKSDDIVSCASCTTNCLSPITDVIKRKFGIKKALMTTIHSYTASQNLIDSPHKKDKRRGRAAALNMLPTTTGAAIATTEVIPSLKNKFDGLAVRVPTAVGSITDAVYLLKKKTNADAVNKAFSQAAKGRLKGVLDVSDEALVSSDIVGNSYSAIVDSPSTKVVDGDLLKVIAWYDNEWGYSSRLVELADYMAKKYIK